MGSVNFGNHFNNFSELTPKEIQLSDNAARKILNGRESLTKTEFQNTSLFNKYKDNENFIKLVDSFGTDIDAEELSFLVTVLDASKYNASGDGEEFSIMRNDGRYLQANDPDFWENVDGNIYYKPDTASGFYLDGIYGNNINSILEVTHEDFEQFKQARANANKPNMGL